MQTGGNEVDKQEADSNDEIIFSSGHYLYSTAIQQGVVYFPSTS